MIDHQLIFLFVTAVSLYGTSEVAIFYGIATNDMFIRSPVTLTALSSVRLGDIKTFDFNYDGLIDLAICSSFMSGTQTDGLMSVFYNTGDDRQFEWNSYLSTSFRCHIFDIAKLDNDEKQRKTIFYIYFIFEDTSLLVIFATTDYSMIGSIIQPIDLDRFVSSMTKGRFNDDEFEDLALIFPETDTLQIVLSNEGKIFTQEIYFTAPHPTSVIRINFNNDLIDDLAVLTCNRTVTIFLGTSSGFMDQKYLSFVPNKRTSTQCAHSLKAADLNGDGRDDLVFIDAETHSIGVLLSTNCYE